MDGWTVLQLDEREGEYRVIAQPTTAPTSCPTCGSGQLHKFGTRPEVIMDLPMHGKRVGIQAQRRRFRCRACSQTFVEPTPGVDSQHRATERLVDWIAQQSLARTFTNVADEIGLNEITVRRIFNAYTTAQSKDWERRVITPRVLGIDELTLAGGLRCILTNVETPAVIDLLAKRDMKTVAARLSRFPNRETVEVVTIDMWRPYRDACRDILPQAQVVIDKFHVERMATLGLDLVRKRLREELTDAQRRKLKRDRFLLLSRPHKLTPSDQFILDSWIDNFPTLKQAYDLKEAFFRVYDQGTPLTAGAMLDAWTDSIPKDMLWAFKDVLSATKNWRPWILAYFAHRYTNAYTEGLNGLAKMANRNGRGYSFDAIRAKVLFHVGARRTKRGGYAKDKAMWETEKSAAGLTLREAPAEYTAIPFNRRLYGAGLDSIAEIIDNALDAYIGSPFSTDEGAEDEVISGPSSNQ